MIIEEKESYFQEIQKFRQIWVWLIIVPISLSQVGIFGYGMVKQLIFGIAWGDNPMSDTGLLIFGSFFIALGMSLFWLFYAAKLVVEVRNNGLYFQFFPFHISSRKIPWEDLKKYEVRTYNPVGEYGGWGIRYGLKGKAYNVSGNRGVQLELSNGKKVLIGSQKYEEFAKAISIGMEKNKLTTLSNTT
jgi:hypothetical protein